MSRIYQHNKDSGVHKVWFIKTQYTHCKTLTATKGDSALKTREAFWFLTESIGRLLSEAHDNICIFLIVNDYWAYFIDWSCKSILQAINNIYDVIKYFSKQMTDEKVK
jgi:hypothetical protein